MGDPIETLFSRWRMNNLVVYIYLYKRLPPETACMWCAYSPPHPYTLREYLTTLNNILYVPRSINMSRGWVGMGKIHARRSNLHHAMCFDSFCAFYQLNACVLFCFLPSPDTAITSSSLTDLLQSPSGLLSL